ncbi:MAG: pitrilysin family protein [Candidatus Spechtbacterales bacterium]|nr:pitrilysin family protein [Candidatus Spechtbacterales bacterium]
MSINIKYKIITLDNGIRVISVPLKSTAAVTSLVLVGTGNHYEPKDKVGLSHFLEHLVFKGSKKYPSAIEISTTLESIGAQYNAFTSSEQTGFYVKTIRDKAELALDVMSDFLKNPLFSEEEIERERGVIIEEMRMYYDDLPRTAHDLLGKALYGDQPAGYTDEDQEKSIPNITPKDIKDYFKKQYVGKNIVVVLAGDMSNEDAEVLAKKYFDDVPKGEPFEKEAVSPVDPNGERIYSKEKESGQTHLAFGFPGPSINDELRYPAGLLSIILGGGMSSRLFTEVRERLGLAYYVGAGSARGTDFGYFMVRAGVANDNVEKALEVIIRELKKIKKEPVTEKELQKAKSAVEGGILLGLETSDDVAGYYGKLELLTGKILQPEEYLEKIKDITVDDIQEAAKSILKHDTMRLSVVGPSIEEKKITDIIKNIS